MIGKTISHYKILEKLGEGGMGVVYKAEDLKLKRIVALKFLPPELTRDPEAKERFIQEAQAASALDHPNICTIHEIDETTDGQLFIVMACYDGETLKKKIASGQSREAGSRSAGLAVDSVIDIAIQIAQGLVKSHEHGIVHRDIKPGNIMITKDGMVKILDFGLAKLVGKTRLTKTGTTMGTIAYISPEQAQGEEADHRSDIWSLGVVMYEMLTGELPFKGKYDQVLIYSIIDQIPAKMSYLRPEIPIELETIVNKTLTKNPEERYQNINDLIADIKDTANINKQELSTRTTKFPARNRLLFIGAVALMLFFLLIFGQPFFKGKDEVINSIAVLPFKNLMNDPTQDYFVEGMHDAIITNLSHVTALKKVISRTSVMRYKDTEIPIPDIAQELDVDALIEGSVLRDGDQVRITAQLIHGTTDRHLWAKSYDQDLKNVLVLLSKVSQDIINEIEIVLTQQEKNRLNAVRVVNPEAHDAHLKARYYFYKFTGVEDFNLALKYYQKAIDIDPNFARSWAALSSVYALLGGFGYVPVGEAMSKAKEAAYKALELDSQLAGAHTALGFALLYDWDWQGAEKAFQRALELNPNDPFAYHGLGDYLTIMGNLEQGLNLVIKGRACSPFSPIASYPVAGHLYLLHRYDEVIDEANRQIDMGPNFQRVRSVLSDALWQKGMYEQSIEELRKTRYGKDNKLMEALEKGYINSGAKGAMLSAAQLLAVRSKSKHVDPLDVAFYFARAEEVDATFNWLEKAYQMRAPLLWHVKVSPEYDFLRSDKRYHDLLNRMGL